MASLQDPYYVVCDSVGTPFLYFSPSGSLAKEVGRSPYGHTTYDSNPSIRIPIGMFGGIQVIYLMWYSLKLEGRGNDTLNISFIKKDYSSLNCFEGSSNCFLFLNYCFSKLFPE